MGKTYVGKSSIINRYIYDRFTPYTTATIGASYFTKVITVNDKQIKLNLWDTSGLERYNSLLPMYYRGTHVAILVFDVTKLSTFNECQKMIEDIKNHVDDVKIILLANKCDKKPTPEYRREIKYEDGLLLAQSNNLLYCECSALDGHGVVEAFDLAIKQLNLSIHSEAIREPPIRLEPEEQPKKCCN